VSQFHRENVEVKNPTAAQSTPTASTNGQQQQQAAAAATAAATAAAQMQVTELRYHRLMIAATN
jgi:hypothetical protein